MAKYIKGPELEGKQLDQITIILADDHPLMRQALRMWIEKQQDMAIIAEAADGKEAVEIATKLKPDVVIIDIGMPKLNGVEAIKQITSKCPKSRLLALTVYTDDEHILSALRAGASGYLSKNISGEEIVHTIRAIMAGETVIPPTVSPEVIEDGAKENKPLTLNRLNELTPREIAVLRFAAKGMANKDIAIRLGLSVRSVKANFTNLFLKLGVTSRTEAISLGLKAGTITLDDLNE